MENDFLKLYKLEISAINYTRLFNKYDIYVNNLYSFYNDTKDIVYYGYCCYEYIRIIYL